MSYARRREGYIRHMAHGRSEVAEAAGPYGSVPIDEWLGRRPYVRELQARIAEQQARDETQERLIEEADRRRGHRRQA